MCRAKAGLRWRTCGQGIYLTNGLVPCIVFVANLRAGDILVTLNGEKVVVEQIQRELLENPITVYNLEVADFHSYFVGSVRVLVHNKCGKIPKNGIEM
jgi:hypothetical protein